MVNKKTDKIRKIIIDNLNKCEVVSGEYLSSITGVSRVAIWKQINTLIKAGYPIVSGRNGYKLDNITDELYPWEFEETGYKFFYYKTTDSTMIRSREKINSGCSDNFIVIAGTQTDGIGRHGRQWDSGSGGLFFTAHNKLSLSVSEYYTESIRSLLAIYRTLSFYNAGEIRIKWPNDILIDKKKIAGVLTEFYSSGDKIEYIDTGIGINLNNAPSPVQTASLSQIIKRDINKREFFLKFLDNYKNSRFDNAELAFFNTALRGVNGEITVNYRGKKITGKLVKADYTGALNMMIGSKKIRIYPGETG